VDGNGSDVGNVYLSLLVDTTPPQVQSITRVSSDTGLGTVSFDVVFSEAVTGVDNSDFQLVTTGHIKGASMANAPFPLSASTYRITVFTGRSTGTIGLNVIDNNSIQDIAGNALAGPSGPNGFFQGPVYTFRTGRRLR
jgi:MSHA biogenesis protein MshQ